MRNYPRLAKITALLVTFLLIIPLMGSRSMTPDFFGNMISEGDAIGWTPVSGDWDNDGYSEAGFYDPSTGIWRLKSANTWNASVTYLQWGSSGWIPVPGDWDNDGYDEVGHYDPATGVWRLKSANTWNASVTYLQWGSPGWVPVSGDWDNDGYDEVGHYDPATGVWRLKSANTWNASVTYLQWGASGWIPVTGDWDNDGYDEVGHYDPATGVWRLKSANTWNASVTYLQWGTSGWVPISGDWDNDGYGEVGSYDQSTLVWRFKLANLWNGTVNYLQWGSAGSAITCYTLTRNYVGTGSAPTANPANSPGCPSGKYTSGQAITLTANPGSGWGLDYWTGTTCSSCPYLTMPSANRTVTAYYEQTSPTTLRVINDLYDVETGCPDNCWDWGLYNSIIWLKTAPTCADIIGDGFPFDGNELLWPWETTQNASETWRLPPDYLNTNNYWDFDISGISTAPDGSYCLLVLAGWWDAIYSPPSYAFSHYEKTPTYVDSTTGLCMKGVLIDVFKPYGNPEIIKASDWLPHGNYPGACP